MPFKKNKIKKLVAFSPEEWEQVCKKAEELKMRVGTYIRLIAVKGEIKNINMVSLNELRMEINRIGNNINQIVHLANETKTVTRKDIDSLKKWLAEVKDTLKYWFNKLL